jgi:hypothetical protein
MADLIYRNALRAARELWYDEQNLGELIEDAVPAMPHDATPHTWSLCSVRVACQCIVR